MSRSADVSTVTRRSAAFAVCGVAALVMLVTGHIGWGILSGVVTVGGAAIAAGSLGTLRSGKAVAAVAVPVVVTLLALIAAFSIPLARRATKLPGRATGGAGVAS